MEKELVNMLHNNNSPNLLFLDILISNCIKTVLLFLIIVLPHANFEIIKFI
jgi:hypothetical protein